MRIRYVWHWYASYSREVKRIPRALLYDGIRALCVLRAQHGAFPLGRHHLVQSLETIGSVHNPIFRRRVAYGFGAYLLSIDEREVVQRYYDGLDVYSPADLSANRMVINFSGMGLEEIQERFPSALEIVRERVKPYRDTVKPEGTRTRWWLYARDRPAMHTAIQALARALVKT